MTHASLFSGIGGCEVAAAMLGWENLFHCEINPFGRSVLDYWFPNSESYEDITKTNFEKWRGRVDVLTGGFPCQPFSYAGQRRGAADDRYLWPEMLRAIQECRPTWVIGENVAGITTMVEQGEIVEVGVQTSLFGETDTLHSYELRQRYTLERVCTDLESIGYSVQPMLIPACAVGAPHRRDRIFIVGHLIADTYKCDDGRDTRGDGGEERAERIQERDAVRLVGSASEVRRENQINASSDSNECGAGTSREGRGTQSSRSHGYAEQSERVIETERTDGLHAVLRASSHTSTDGLQHGNIAGIEGSQVGTLQGTRDCSERDIPTPADGIRGTASDTESEQGDGCGTIGRCSREESSQLGGSCVQIVDNQQFNRWGQNYECGQRWAAFPTVSPIHRGNDGIPFDVDCLAIPFSKWRQEALKAYGNAIVPQVVYEIFRAIEEVEQSNTKSL